MANRKWFFDYLPKIKEMLIKKYIQTISIYELYNGQHYIECKIATTSNFKNEIIIIEITKRNEDILIYKLQKE